MIRINRAALQAGLALGLTLISLACQDAQGPTGKNVRDSLGGGPTDSLIALASLIVSNPKVPGSIPGLPSGSADQLIYASLPPGSISNGKAITVTNRATGEQISADLVDGGFDPLPLTAEVGDTLDILIETNDGSVEEFSTLVPAFRPPVVVRVDPPPAKRDVPLNTIIRLVISEPIDPGTITGGSVQLLFNGTLVGGSLAFEDPSNLVVTLAQPQNLLAGADYTVTVTRGVTDVTGDPLAAVFRSTFTTVALPPTPGAAGIYVATLDGSGTVSAEVWIGEGARPDWSPDGQHIAFDWQGGIYVMDPDGGNATRIGDGLSPAWSPDGTRIAYTGLGGINVMNADGTGIVQLIRNDFDTTTQTPMGIGKPTWSPDGQMIAFEHFGDGGDYLPAQIWYMNADGSNPRLLNNFAGTRYAESDPSWSTRQNAIVHWSYGYGIAFTDTAGNLRNVYFNFPFACYGAKPDVSPDGSTILFVGRTPLDTSVYAVGSSGLGFRLMIYDAMDATWSPDGSRIAFVRVP